MRGTDAVWGPIAIRAEAARASGAPLGGFSADLWKYYDQIDPEVALDFLEHLGLDKQILVPLRSFDGQLWKILSLNGAVGEGLRSFQAVLQGCAWSSPLASAIGAAWSWWAASWCVAAWSWWPSWVAA